MDDKPGYAVFFFEQAIELLGEALKPYLVEGKAGLHVACREVDTSGSLIEMTLDGRDDRGRTCDIELMVPVSMVRMIVSARGDDVFGFVPRAQTPIEPALPPLGPTAAPVEAPPQQVPDAAREPDAPVQTPGRP